MISFVRKPFNKSLYFRKHSNNLNTYASSNFIKSEPFLMSTGVNPQIDRGRRGQNLGKIFKKGETSNVMRIPGADVPFAIVY